MSETSSPHTPALWRPMTQADIPAVSYVASIAHVDFPEDDAVFAERQRLAPEGCWILEQGEEPIGYILSHPWHFGSVPSLNMLLENIPADADTFYIHDLALLPQARGTGAARKIVELLIEQTQSYPSITLVAVNGSLPFWSKFGFEIKDLAELKAKLLSYDEDARYMQRTRG